ncbi:hypothetical protein CISG_08092 [Coccidioides immitis RMSCC 3703]|uniref:Uncharacterized protein n=2 Tax=Coccidioides immitis TaxID=5501 RepID=A0A0J8U0M6_COCIT|nr:hypothetical protein CIRG_02218 [Coccidioides immitis RMSCC 2394]KMU79812.1 hypothetical protein CISG_08092 [Coccidioides immitis RMSCC 3703]
MGKLPMFTIFRVGGERFRIGRDGTKISGPKLLTNSDITLCATSCFSRDDADSMLVRTEYGNGTANIIISDLSVLCPEYAKDEGRSGMIQESSPSPYSIFNGALRP